jgi:hypothetical protein
MAGGVSDVVIAKRYSLARSSVQRHRQHVGAPNSTVVAERKSAAFQALASLPSAAEVNQAYASITSRIDAIAAKAETEGSLAVALMGLRELRSTVTAQAQLAGHVGSGAQFQVNTQVNVDMGSAVKEIIAALRPPPDAAIPPSLPFVSATRTSLPSQLSRQKEEPHERRPQIWLVLSLASCSSLNAYSHASSSAKLVAMAHICKAARPDQ